MNADAIKTLEVRIETKRKSLINEMRRLSQLCLAVAERLEEDSSVSPNPSGEVQGRGNSVDALCGEVAALEDALRTIKAFEMVSK